MNSAHGGRVDELISDAVRAVVGSPVGRGAALEARTAVRCTLAMAQPLQPFNDAWRGRIEPEPFVPLANGVGLASGAA